MGLGSDGYSIAPLRTDPTFILYPKLPWPPLKAPPPFPLLGIRLQEVPPFPQHTQLYLTERNQAKTQTALSSSSHNTSDTDPQTSHPDSPTMQKRKRSGHKTKNVTVLTSTYAKKGPCWGLMVCARAVLSWSTFSSVHHLHLKECVMSPCSEQQQFNMRETRVESAVFQRIRYQEQQLAYCNISLRLNK